MLVVHGGSNTAVVRDRTGHPVVLLSGPRPEHLTSAILTTLLDLAAAVLTPGETERLARCLTALRHGETVPRSRLELNGESFTLYATGP
ncbi:MULTISPECIES: hypothetical protein [Kitasatospora]|uniref:Uncharacterized protein n=2 Tax=Kitasatospora TaxID=2063 RepID=A0ABT1J7Z5_9ACTN|nr:hypothetical protein [Kitasatospora paracochleata]MCP2313324.1 hypothetical protein [Kitasatospora paracochleata]